MADEVSQPSELSAPKAEQQVEAHAVRHGGGRRRSAYATRDLTRGSIPRNLWHLGWPQVAEGFLSVIDQIADLIWAGRLGFQAIAGLGVAQSYVMLLMTTRMGFDSSMRAMVSRAIGGRNIPYANHVLLQSLNLATLFSLLVSTLGILLTDTLLRVLGVSDAVASQAAGYMRLQFVAMAVMSYQRLSAGALQASGDSFTPLKAATVTRVSHLVLSPVLIFGWGWFPAMGLAGAACANLVAQCLGVGMNFVALFAGSSRLQLTLKGYTFDAPLIWRLLKVGAPASVTGAQRAITNLVFLSIVAPFGDGALAAFSLTRRTENVVMQSSRGLGRAAGALAGQNLGAGQPDRAKSSVLWAIGYVGIASSVLAVIFILFPHAVASFFNSDAEFVALASRWLVIQAIGVISFSAVQVLTQAFNTSGETLAPMVVTLTTAWLVELPLAIALSRFTSLGEFGVPWATVVGMTLRMALLSGHFFRGRWLKTGMI